MNDVKLSGRLGTDPVLRYTTTSKAVVNLRVAVDRPGVDDPDWFDVTAWGPLADTVAGHLHKGDQVLIDGYLRPDTITVDDKNYSTVSVHANRIEFGARSRTAVSE